jgi:hypothetical protein
MDGPYNLLLVFIKNKLYRKIPFVTLLYQNIFASNSLVLKPPKIGMLRTLLRIRIRPDPDLFGRIRILAFINEPILNFWVCVKAINTSGIKVV